MQDEWYQDVIPEDIGRILCDGAIWSQVGGTGRWSLRGRDLYVLGEHSDLSGWVSQPCLKLGRKHVILCTEQLRPAVEQALREAGADHSVALDILFGSPAGWVVFRDVVPVRPAPASGRTDILNALLPLPELEICLEGGIRLEYSAWLDGYPPLIRVYGDPADTPEVRIDGCTACCGDDGAYRASAWDATGTHTIWCAGISKSYSIVPFQASWALWDTYVFSIALESDRRVFNLWVRCARRIYQSRRLDSYDTGARHKYSDLRCSAWRARARNAGFASSRNALHRISVIPSRLGSTS